MRRKEIGESEMSEEKGKCSMSKGERERKITGRVLWKKEGKEGSRRVEIRCHQRSKKTTRMFELK